MIGKTPKKQDEEDKALFQKINQGCFPASTQTEGDLVHLVIDYDKFSLPKKQLARLWKNGTLSVRAGILTAPKS
jgi:hypothetical protein